MHGDGSKLLRYEPSGGNMITRTRCLVTAFVCVTGLCASFATLSGVSGAGTKIPSVNGIWLTYSVGEQIRPAEQPESGLHTERQAGIHPHHRDMGGIQGRGDVLAYDR